MVVVGVFFFAVHGHLQMGAGDAAFHGGFPRKIHAGNGEGVELGDKCVRIWQEFEQGGGEHGRRQRPCCSRGIMFSSESPYNPMWLMLLAR